MTAILNITRKTVCFNQNLMKIFIQKQCERLAENWCIRTNQNTKRVFFIWIKSDRAFSLFIFNESVKCLRPKR